MSFISFLFVGLTGVVFFSCVTKFSSTWFSDGERATSTGLAFVMANLGNFGTYSNQVSILSGPSKVQSVEKDTKVYAKYYMVKHSEIILFFYLHISLISGF